MTEASSIAETARTLRAGDVSSVELTRAALDAADRLDSELGVYLSRFDDQALAAAAAADAAFAAGDDRGPLQGVPLGVKDLLASREGPTTAHSLVPDPPAPPGVDASSVQAIRDAGAIILGKVSLNEFAFGVPDPSSGLPTPRNPWALDRWPGGSSSGTAAGIAGGLFVAGLGTDSGGSIRIPASLCGVTGLKPTFGLIPTDGCIPMSPSSDTIGPMGGSAEDCALLLDVLSSPSHPERPPLTPAVVAATDLRGLRIGVERAHHGQATGADPAILSAIDQALTVLESAGAHIDDVVLEHCGAAHPANLIMTHVESLAHHRANLQHQWSRYGTITRSLLASGAFYSGADYIDAQYVRALVRAEAEALLVDHDIIVTPTLGLVAPRMDSDFVALMPLFYTGVWNTTGHPAMSVPAGEVDGLPVGMQIVGRMLDEATVLRVGHVYQLLTDWHLRRPKVAAHP